MSLETDGKKLIKQHNDKFEKYFNMLIETNKQFNLTAITTKSEVFEKHFLDSIASLQYLKQNAKIIDVGAGAGFPSLPLKIVRDDLSVTMLDSLNKRVNFLNNVTESLGLKDILAIHGRAEDAAINPLYREKFDVAVARAVACLNTLLEYLGAFVKIGGFIVAYKGISYQEEVTGAEKAAAALGLQLYETLNYTLPYSGLTRTLVVYKKVKETPPEYPRDKNRAKTNPL